MHSNRECKGTCRQDADLIRIDLHHLCITGVAQIEIDDFIEIDASFCLGVNLTIKITENT